MLVDVDVVVAGVQTQEVEGHLRCCAAVHEAPACFVLGVAGTQMIKELVPSIERTGALARAVHDWTWETDGSGMLLHVPIVLVLAFESFIRATSRPFAF